jgi:hypothetical protein
MGRFLISRLSIGVYAIAITLAMTSFLRTATSGNLSNAYAATANPVLVELFTSEGCSDCPPADALLAELAARQGVADSVVIALSEHVDYWDHLGWRDPFSSHPVSERQSAYGRRFQLDSVYTPQMVIDGKEQMVGSDRNAVTGAIRSAGRHANPLALEIAPPEWHGDSLHFELSITGTAPSKPAEIYAALADDKDVSSVAKGENHGRTLMHVAVVRSLQIVGSTSGSLTKVVDLQAPPGLRHGQMHLVVFVQQPGPGLVLGVASHPI